MKVVLVLLAGALAFAVWRWASLVLDPLGLGAFWLIGRMIGILAVLTIAETIYHKVSP